jgi:hypothetical protein
MALPAEAVAWLVQSQFMLMKTQLQLVITPSGTLTAGPSGKPPRPAALEIGPEPHKARLFYDKGNPQQIEFVSAEACRTAKEVLIR